MNIFEKLFGKWETVSAKLITETLTSNDLYKKEVEAYVVLEKNSKTGKKRAYLEYFNGRRSYISVHFAEGIE